ncbi:MAG: DNA polymerase III subunit gamma/tau [Gemmatimonadetes bacterium]|nr:MAG: DNA polymerase III subunit gamma/tau [Gemmatimonadota bacterium]
MAYQVLARKWRPQEFDGVIAQHHITQTLKRAIETGHIAHAYLFCGPRGVGKTTTARILAKALNCAQGPTPEPCNTCTACQEITTGTSMDVIEIDGASNNSVDDVRDLREKVNFTPTRGKYKVYIIDEVHMLSSAAFNALLKTLEEPPPHVIFIFATTEVHKVLPTILSRCQRFDFKRIETQKIVAWLHHICQHENVEITEEALYLIARRADGGMRDAESILDKVISFKRKAITLEDVTHLLGVVSEDILFQLTGALLRHQRSEVLNLLDKTIRAGYDIAEFANGLAEHLRNLLIAKVSDPAASMLELPESSVERYQQTSVEFEVEDLLRLLRITMEAQQELRKSSQPRLIFEVALVRMTQLKRTVKLEDLLQRLAKLEEKIATLPPAADSHVTNSSPVISPKPQPEPRRSQPTPVTPKATPPPADSIPLDQPQRIWTVLKRRVQQEKPILSTNLSSISLIEITPECARLAIPVAHAHAKMFVEHHQEFIRQLLTHICGVKIREIIIEIQDNGENATEENVQVQRVSLEEVAQETPSGKSAKDILTPEYIQKWTAWGAETFSKPI